MDTDNQSQIADLRDLLNEWDPIDVRDDGDGPDDEYDCLLWGVLGELQRGATPYTVASYLQHEMREYFGLTEFYHPLFFGERLVQWYRTRSAQ